MMGAFFGILASTENGDNISFITMSTLSSYLGILGIWEKKCS
jgi:hypothetical protein